MGGGEAQRGGGKNERKSHVNAQKSAAEELVLAMAEFDLLKEKPNKTRADKELLRTLQARVKHLRAKASEKSESHSQRPKGPR